MRYLALILLPVLCLGGCGLIDNDNGRYQMTPGGALIDTRSGAAYLAVGGNVKEWVLYVRPVQPK
jgi:hypothetical protein